MQRRYKTLLKKPPTHLLPFLRGFREAVNLTQIYDIILNSIFMNCYINLIMYSIKLHSIYVWLSKRKENGEERDKHQRQKKKHTKKLQDPAVWKILEPY